MNENRQYSTQKSSDLRSVLFEELGEPRARWMSIIGAELEENTRERVPDIAHRVFDVLARRYQREAVDGALVAHTTIEAALKIRFAQEAGPTSRVVDLMLAVEGADGQRRRRWLNLVESRMYPETRAAIPDVTQLVFDRIVERCLGRAADGTLPTGVDLDAFLTVRMSMDAGREAGRLLSRWNGEALEYDDGDPIAEAGAFDEQMLADALLDDGRLPARVEALVRSGLLGDAEREAFELRAACGFEPQAVYRQHGLDDKAERNKHNNCFLVACRKLRTQLEAEGYAA